MVKYIKYNPSSTTNILIGRNESQRTGNISKISICNENIFANGDTLVNIFLHDGDTANDISIIKNLSIPPGVTLILEDNLSFNINIYSLKINTVHAGTGSMSLSIIIK